MAWEQEPACCTRRDACDATRPRAPGHTGYVRVSERDTNFLQIRCANVYGHTQCNIPYLVRTAQSSHCRPRQYYGGGPRGNPGCRRLSFCFFLLLVADPAWEESLTGDSLQIIHCFRRVGPAA